MLNCYGKLSKVTYLQGACPSVFSYLSLKYKHNIKTCSSLKNRPIKGAVWLLNIVK